MTRSDVCWSHYRRRLLGLLALPEGERVKTLPAEPYTEAFLPR
jgi:hypothetical protein